MYREADSRLPTLLKPQFKHVNLCSYRDMRRIDPANMKTDCFLMMAMPEIWLKATSR